MNEQIKPVTAEDYVKQHNPTKMITLPSGAIFEIRAYTVRDYIKDGGTSIPEAQGASPEKIKELYSKLTPEQKQKQAEIQDLMITKCCVSPKISMTREPGKLYIDDIKGSDYYELIVQISEFGGIDIKSFRNRDTSDTN